MSYVLSDHGHTSDANGLTPSGHMFLVHSSTLVSLHINFNQLESQVSFHPDDHVTLRLMFLE